jgi:hypothetical protein
MHQEARFPAEELQPTMGLIVQVSLFLGKQEPVVRFGK